MSYLETFLQGIDSLFAWLSSSLKQTTEAYCDLETADDETTLVTHDGALLSIVKINGATALIGSDEFDQLQRGLTQSLSRSMTRSGHSLQVFFDYNQDRIFSTIEENFFSAKETAKRLKINLDDLFNERTQYLSKYCAHENVYFVLKTSPVSLNKDQVKAARAKQTEMIKKNNLPHFHKSQNLMAAIPDLRNIHHAFVKSMIEDMRKLDLSTTLLNTHDALYHVRMTVDPNFTDNNWKPMLPGDHMTAREVNQFKGDASDILWPPIAKQVIPRDAENIDLHTARIGDTIYSTVFVELFPKDLKNFIGLFSRAINANIPWRISFFIESEGLPTMRFKKMISSILSFSSFQNKLINESSDLLSYINVNHDEALVRLRVSAATWAPDYDIALLRNRTAELAKIIEGWGSCEVGQATGDAFAGAASSMLAMTSDVVATAAVAPLSDVVYMLPITRPASPWNYGALLFRSPDGKIWPFQPGSSVQTTWIDLVYARPGSGKSVLSNALNLALCLSAGIQRLPRIAVIDIGPSSSGLISLLRESLPLNQKHLVAYHRLRMTDEYSINPFDTQLGARCPTPQERSFLVNFLTLLVTPVGDNRPYDGIPDLAGMVIDEMYKSFSDANKPSTYDHGIEHIVDGLLEEIGFIADGKTTWFEVTDALFTAGFSHEAMLAQRHAMPLLADAASICRTPAIEDLYGKIIAPTGESLINAFSRMISSSVREYPILSRVTQFDIGEARVVSLDLDEVAKSGGAAADRQTAVMYMLARYCLAKNFYLHDDNVQDMPDAYKEYHKERIAEIKEDPKRLVYDEFHRTSKAQAVREQVIIDMREGRKWKVQISLLSQSIEDFDEVMIEFATAIYVMDAGPASTIDKTSSVFGLSPTAKIALSQYVHGPREGGATFLAQYSTKSGSNVQLLTLTLGPVELWAFSTTSEDAIIRNQLYKYLGPKEARRVLATLFPSGTVVKVLEERLSLMQQNNGGLIKEEDRRGAIDKLLQEILEQYSKNPDIKRLAS